jgi:murein DD-endopeptidase MepM/ murein hydrolase activator NlpD
MQMMRRSRWVLGVLVVGCVVLPGGVRAGALARDQRGNLEQTANEAAAAQADAQARLGRLHLQQEGLDSRIAALATRIGAASALLDSDNRAADAMAGRYYALDEQLQQMQAALGTAREAFRSVAADLYEQAAWADLPQLVASSGPSGSLLDRGAAEVYLHSVVDGKLATVTQVTQLADRTRALRSQTARQRVQLEAARRTAEAQRQALQQLQGQQQAAADQLARETASVQSLEEQAAARKRDALNQLAALEAQSTSIEQMLARRQAGQVRAARFLIVRPVPGPIVSPFGLRYHPILKVWRMHTGDDLEAAWGDPIRAAADGVVVYAGPNGGYGNCTIVDHGNQYATLYAHQSSIAVSVGDTVHAGEIIGAVGATGLATGPHLHFEIRVLGNPIDPAPYL